MDIPIFYKFRLLIGPESMRIRMNNNYSITNKNINILLGQDLNMRSIVFRPSMLNQNYLYDQIKIALLYCLYGSLLKSISIPYVITFQLVKLNIK